MSFYCVIVIVVLAIALPFSLAVIHWLNETWFDLEWRIAIRERKSSFNLSQFARRGKFHACCLGLLTELVFAMIGVAVGAYVYLPGPMDGWFYFSIIIFATGGGFFGLPFSLSVLIYQWRKHAILSEWRKH